MKKTTKLATLFLSALLSVLSVTACSVFSNQPDNGGTNDSESSYAPKTQTITVYNDETPTTYTVTLGEVAQIDAFTKPGYYFVGAFDAAEEGTKYFDSNGNSTMVWGAGNPDTYYTRFESISTLNFTQILYDEEPVSGGQYGLWFEFEFDETFKTAINSNLDTSLSVTVSFAATNSRGWNLGNCYLTNLKKGGENYYIIEDDSVVTLDKTKYTILEKQFTIKAKLIKNGKMYLYINTNLVSGYSTYSVKNLTLSASFITEEA